nr:ATP-binding protein [Candidatus Kapabacteria bacterium]
LQITDFENLNPREQSRIRQRYSSRKIDDLLMSGILQCVVQDFKISQEGIVSEEPFETIAVHNISDEGYMTARGRLGSGNGNVLTARRYDAGMSKKLHPLIVEKSIQSIVSVLSQVDDKIVGIQLGLNDSVLFDIGLPRLVPLHVMGDGMRQTLSILATIATSRNEIVFIDEIDNGLHYSTLSILWEAILKAAKEFNVQIFATTHSYECLAALARVQEANLFGEDIVRVFRLERDGEEHRAVKIDGEDLRIMIGNNWELR